MRSPGPGEDLQPLTVTVTSTEGVVWIEVRGEVDLSNCEQLRTSLAGIELAPASRVYLDLGLLTFCDSAGCGILLRYETDATATGHNVKIHRASTNVRKVMSILSELEESWPR